MKSLVRAYSMVVQDIESVGEKPNYDNVTRAMRLCPHSWPCGEQEERAYEVMVRCVGDMGINDPYPSLPYDEHPAIFFDYMNIYASAKIGYLERGKDGNSA